MKFDHLGDVAPVLLVELAEGDKAVVPVGSVRYRDPSVGVDRLKLSLSNPFPGDFGPIWEYFEVLEGPGTATVSTGRIGEVRRLRLDPEESLRVHPGAILARDATTEYQLVSLVNTLTLAELAGPGLVALQTRGNVLSFALAKGEKLRAPPYSVVSVSSGTHAEMQAYVGGPNLSPSHYFSVIEFTGPGTVLLHSGRFESGEGPA